MRSWIAVERLGLPGVFPVWFWILFPQCPWLFALSVLYWDLSRANSEIHNTQNYKHTKLQTHNLLLTLFLSKVGQNSNKVRMCHDWFRIDYFRLNLHLIIEVLVHICWRSEFIIVRSLCCEITQLIISNFVRPLIRIVHIFESAMLAHHPLWRVRIKFLYYFCQRGVFPQGLSMLIACNFASAG